MCQTTSAGPQMVAHRAGFASIYSRVMYGLNTSAGNHVDRGGDEYRHCFAARDHFSLPWQTRWLACRDESLRWRGLHPIPKAGKGDHDTRCSICIRFQLGT